MIIFFVTLRQEMTIHNMKTKLFTTILTCLFVISCQEEENIKTVICIPVYGQSLALGEEATRVTDFDSLSNYANGRIVTERMDHQFGFFDNNPTKQWIKRIIGYYQRSFELSLYGMAETLCDHTGQDTLICIFPGGQGATDLYHLRKGTEPYLKFLKDIKTAYNKAQSHKWKFSMPLLCWMQGESDIAEYPGTDYRSLILQFIDDINKDVCEITGQKDSIHFICYQTNPVTSAAHFNPNSFNCPETKVPETLLELVRDDERFHASGPTYPYTFARERIHIDGLSHKQHGRLIALTALDVLQHRKIKRGLLPLSATVSGKEIIIKFQIPAPPLVFDTIHIAKASNYGFSVISPSNIDIAKHVYIKDNNIHIECKEQPNGCRVRYAINGEKMFSGKRHGPRGNLRDSQGENIKTTIRGKSYPLHNWCWQFDIRVLQKAKT